MDHFKPVLFSLLLLSSFFVYRCSDDTVSADASGLCATDDECPIGQYCADGVCTNGTSECDEQNPCPDGAECRNNTCVSIGNDGGTDGDDGGDGADTDTEHGPDIEIISPQQSAGVYQMDFGNVLVGVMVERDIVVKNAGDDDLRILDLNFEAGTDLDDFSLDQATMDSLPLIVAPDEQITIPVRYQATDATTDHSVLDIISNDPDEALVKIHLLSEFKGEPKVAVSKDSLDFGDVPLGETSEPLEFSISNQGSGNAVLSVDDVRLAVIDNEDFDLQVVDVEQQQVEFPALLNNGDVLDVTVNYHPQIQEQDSDRVLIVSDDPDSPSVEVAITGRGVVGDVTVDPSPVNLGKIRVGASASQDITITNSGGAQVQLTSVQLVDSSALWTVNSSDVDLETLADTPYGLDPGGLIHAQVAFAADSVGVASGTLLVSHTGPSGQVETALSAEGYIPAHATLDPQPPLVFSDVQWDQGTSTGESRSINIDVGNDGGENLLISSVHLANSSPEFTWQNAPASISPGQHQQMTVIFTPDSSGSVDDRLFLETNDPDAQYDGVTGRVVIELQANAIDPAMIVVPMGVHDFGQVMIGDTDAFTVTILSASPDPLLVTGIELAGGGSADFSLLNIPDISNPLVGQGASMTFDVVYAPSDTGPDTGQVVITSSDMGNPIVTIALSGSSPGCPEGWGDCDNAVAGCETQLNSLDDCGACDTPCSLPNANPTCATGTCEVESCVGTWDDCDSNEPGCETDLSSDPDHCLSCDNTCTYDHAIPICGASGCQMGDCLDDYWNLDGSSANGCEYHCVYQSPLDEPDALFVDSNCDGIDGDIASAVFVSPLGMDTNAGTMSQPLRNISAGISLAQSQSTSQVLVAAGSYNEDSTLVLQDGVSVFGGYDPISWLREGGQVPVITVASTTAVRASGIFSSTVLELLRFEGEDASSPGQSAYGLYASSSNGLVIRSCEFHAGLGGNGSAGSTPGGTAASGSNGTAGQSGCEDSSGLFCSSCGRPYGGAGGTSACGRTGGTGGRPGRDSSDGDSGGTGVGGTGGGSGTPDGHGNWNTPSTYWGHDGANGAVGSDGTSGSFVFTSTGYLTSNGLGGGQGENGNGGGGGGGGGGGTTNCNSYGGGGGGGGAGGCGGAGGGGGTSAGGSFAVYLWNSSIHMSNSTLVTAGGGTGGDGGNAQPGGSGGEGGHGSLTGAGNGYGGGDEQDDGSNGGRGGWGGDGSRGGFGGGGAGGCSIGVVAGGTSNPDMVNTNYSMGSSGTGGVSSGFQGPAGIQANLYSP